MYCYLRNYSNYFQENKETFTATIIDNLQHSGNKNDAWDGI